MKRLPPIFQRRRLMGMVRLILIGMAQVGVMVLISILIRVMFDEMSNVQVSDRPLLPLAGLMGVAALVLGGLKWRERIEAESLGQDYISQTRLMVFKHVSALSSRALSRSRKGTILLRFVNDLTALRQWVSLGIARAAVSGVVIIGSMVALVFITPILGATLLAILSLSIVLSLWLGRSLDRTMRESRRRRANLAANLSEKLENMQIVQAFAQKDNEYRKVKRQSGSLKKAMINRASAIGAFRALVQVTITLCLGVAIIVGNYLVRADMASTGDVVAALGLVSLVTPSLFDFGRVYEYRKSATIAAEKTESLLARGPIIPPAIEGKPIKKLKGELVFNDVCVAGVFDGLSARLKPGRTTLLLGDNGAGKSTLLALALRLMDPDKGALLLDGHDIRTIPSGRLRRTISIASSTMPLMSGTIASNILYGSSKAGDEDARAAAAALNMDITTPSSPYYFERRVYEGGSNLSAGERMRVVLARAIVGAPKILLLDEPEGHLDEEGLVALKQLLNNYPGAILMATHGGEIINGSVNVWHLADGGLAVKEGR